MNKILTFEEAIKDAPNRGANKKHLLLGNGFSMAYDSSIFGWRSLYKAAFEKFPAIKKVFEAAGTNDFEVVLKIYRSTINLVKSYSQLEQSKDLINFLENDFKLIQKALVETLKKLHPEKATCINNIQYESCLYFLNHFQGNKIFSTNYDLLLYWVIAKSVEESDGHGKWPKDLFYNKIQSLDNVISLAWEQLSQRSPDLYFLHGALHIFNNSQNHTIKYKYKSNEINMIDQIQMNFDKDVFPLFVSGDSKKSKLSVINDSSYLSKAYSSLGSIGGALFIFGHSMDDNDEHLYDQIVKSNVEHIYFGLRDKTKMDKFEAKLQDLCTKRKLKNKELKKIQQNQNRRTNIKNLTFSFYDPDSANVWGKELNQ